MRWDDVAARVSAGAAAVLPIGAGAKQHGLHMPLGTDFVQAEFFADAIAARTDSLIWPVVAYGFYPAFDGYAGSASLSAATLEAMVREILIGIMRIGPRAIFVVDTGISTIEPVQVAIAEVRGAAAIHHVAIYKGVKYREAAARLATQRYGSHADEIETSLMLAMAPVFVDMARAIGSPESLDDNVPGALMPDDPTSLHYSPSGSWGDPTLATLEKGQALLAAILGDIDAAIDKSLALDSGSAAAALPGPG